MKAANNFNVQPNCFDCEMRSANFFCNLSPTTLQIFESLKITNAYPKGATLFMEGHPTNGIYMLCKGRVKLSTCSRDGKVIILRVAEAGEVLGLKATVSDSNYGATAEVIESCQVNFVRKDDFLRLLASNAEACFSAIKQLIPFSIRNQAIEICFDGAQAASLRGRESIQKPVNLTLSELLVQSRRLAVCAPFNAHLSNGKRISYQYHTAYIQVRTFGLSHTAADKLAKLLLEWCKPNGSGSVRLKISYTHEEIAEMIGTSRETVTRLFKDFRDRELISLKGSDLTIHDWKKLDATIGAHSNTGL